MLADSSSGPAHTRDLPAPPEAHEAASATTAVAAGGTEPATPRKGSFLAPLRIGNFHLRLAGQTVSRIGDQFFI